MSDGWHTAGARRDHHRRADQRATEEEALARARLICPDSAHVIEVRPVTWQWKP